MRVFTKTSLFVIGLCISFSTLAKTSQNSFVESLLQKMTIEEKIGQLTQYTSDMAVTGPTVRENYKEDIRKGRVGSIFNAYTPKFTNELQKIATTETRLKIPLLFGYDVIHGHRTIFPIPLAESSSWDLGLIEKSARVAAIEAAADGIHWVFAPMVDISRDPRWGRISEGAGEDPWLGAKIAAARVKGFQGSDLSSSESVLACVKHFAAYGAPEAGRDYNTVDMSERELFETYLPPYEAAIKAGAGSVMTAFNEVSGVPSTSNEWLLKTILRQRWGFQGMVVSDYTAINELVAHGVATDEREAGRLAFKAGVDMDMQGSVYANHLKALIQSGKISLKELDQSVRRILITKYKLGLFSDPQRGATAAKAEKILESKEHLEVAREVARNSIVLLKNNNAILPISKTAKIAVIGPMAANKRDQVGSWSAAGDWKKAVSLLEGLQAQLGTSVKIPYAQGSQLLDNSVLIQQLNLHGGEISLDPRSAEDLLKEAIKIASSADILILALGEAQGMSGEAASRTRIRLPENQQELLRALGKIGKPIVLVLYSGRPLALELENQISTAIVETWFLGTQSGHAIADMLLGGFNPSGKLTVSFPVTEGQIPIYYSQKTTGRPINPADKTEKYKSKYLDAPNEPLFPFGWGLSYTTFSYSEPWIVRKKHGELEVHFHLENTGTREGQEVAQLYVRDLVASISRPSKQLRGFQKLTLAAGEKKEVTLRLTASDFKFYDKNMKLILEPGDFEIMVGGNSRDLKKIRIKYPAGIH